MKILIKRVKYNIYSLLVAILNHQNHCIHWWIVHHRGFVPQLFHPFVSISLVSDYLQTKSTRHSYFIFHHSKTNYLLVFSVHSSYHVLSILFQMFPTKQSKRILLNPKISNCLLVVVLLQTTTRYFVSHCHSMLS